MIESAHSVGLPIYFLIYTIKLDKEGVDSYPRGGAVGSGAVGCCHVAVAAAAADACHLAINLRPLCSWITQQSMFSWLSLPGEAFSQDDTTLIQHVSTAKCMQTTMVTPRTRMLMIVVQPRWWHTGWWRHHRHSYFYIPPPSSLSSSCIRL